MAQSGFDLVGLEYAHTNKQLLCGEYGRIVEVKYYGASFAATEIVTKEGKRLENLLEQKFYRNSHVLCHPNIVQFLGVYRPSEPSGKAISLLVTELIQETLTSLLETCPNVPLHVKLSILLDVSKGLWYLHSHKPPIVHGELSSNSIFLTSQLVAKVGNLGLVDIAQRDDSKAAMASGHATVDFAAPEASLNASERDPTLDVYSYGRVILHVVNQELSKPLQGNNLSEIKKRGKHLDQIDIHVTPLKQLVETCLQADPMQRPQMKTVCNKMMSIYEPYSGVDNTLWRLDSSADPFVEKIDEIMAAVSDLEKAKLQVEQNDDLITSLRRHLMKEGKPAILNPSGEAIQINWDEEDPLPVGRATSTAVLLNGKVYFGGGFVEDEKYSFTISVYDISSKKWDPNSIKTGQTLFGMTTLDNKLLVAGGVTDDRDIPITKFNVTDQVNMLVEGEWKHFASMLIPKAALTAVGYKAKLIIVGGQTCTSRCIPLADVELLDIITSQWHTCNRLPEPQYQLLATIVNDNLYLMGGSNARKSLSNAVFSASLKLLGSRQPQLEWRYLPCAPNVGSTPVGLYDNFLLALGGKHLEYQSSDVFILNASTSAWEILSTIPAPRSRLGAVNIDNHTLLIMGGGLDGEATSNTWTGIY